MPRFEAGEIARRLVDEMPELTFARVGETAIANARRNLAHAGRGRSAAELRGRRFGLVDAGLVVAAGPSIARHDPAAAIRDIGFDGTIIATDSSMYYLLRNGIVPHLVVTLDPHAKRIVRWFGEPALNQGDLEADDYFRRQDMDADFAREMAVNREVLRLIDKHGSQMTIALATSASGAVVDRVLATGMQIYWWNPMFDDPAEPHGLTRQLQSLNGFPAINAGGNVGSACWMFADAVLGLGDVALAGVDFSYYDDTPRTATQYYHEAVNLVGEDNLDAVYMRIFNPHLSQWFYTDPAYLWYREALLEMVKDRAGRLSNCTEGGILFGEGIDFVPLKSFLRRYSQSAG
jgi:hypothetical protein